MFKTTQNEAYIYVYNQFTSRINAFSSFGALLEESANGEDEAENSSIVSVSTSNRYDTLQQHTSRQTKPQKVYSRIIQRSDLKKSSTRTYPTPYADYQHHSQEQPRARSRVGGKPQDGIVFGTAPPSQLRAAPDNTEHQKNQVQGNRICSGIFVTKLDPKTSIKGLASTIRLRTGCSVVPEKLSTKYGSYSSFYIRCDRQMRDILLDPAIWPRKSWAKPFYS